MNTKIALVTGGSRGLGRDMAVALAKKGSGVIITYNNSKDKAAEVVAEIEAIGRKAAMVQLDTSQVNSLDEFVKNVQTVLNETWGANKLDFLINNAGVGATIPIKDVSESDFDNLMNIHFKGVYFLTQKMLSVINNNGSIINVSSGTTRFCVPGYSVYSSLKSAVETFTKYLAKELGERGIRANVVAPGPVETDFNNAAIRNNPKMKEFLSGQSPLGRVGTPDDIGSVVAFLCSEDAKWINAQRIEVSGGINA